jgi:hypothetical protein
MEHRASIAAHEDKPRLYVSHEHAARAFRLSFRIRYKAISFVGEQRDVFLLQS